MSVLIVFATDIPTVGTDRTNFNGTVWTLHVQPTHSDVVTEKTVSLRIGIAIRKPIVPMARMKKIVKNPRRVTLWTISLANLVKTHSFLFKSYLKKKMNLRSLFGVLYFYYTPCLLKLSNLVNTYRGWITFLVSFLISCFYLTLLLISYFWIFQIPLDILFLNIPNPLDILFLNTPNPFGYPILENSKPFRCSIFSPYEIKVYKVYGQFLKKTHFSSYGFIFFV